MAAIKDLSRISQKWTRVTSGATQEYTEGIQNPRSDWAANTMKASDAWKQGVQQAASQNRFAKGVRKAGNQTWQQAAIEKGPARFSQGVQLAGDKYEAGFAPYRETISGLQLPPRGPKGDPANIQRVAVVAKALHDKKQSLLGG